MSGDIKQVIVIRKDLNMRKGKMCAQAAHASMMFMSDIINGHTDIRPVEKEWLEGNFKKIVVGVDSEDELIEILMKAGLVNAYADLRVRLCQDSGLTEFKGHPTNTCIAIGPDYADRIDPITKDLKLL